MQDAFETVEHRGFKIHLMQDENPQDPRDWCNLGVLALFHSRYDLPNESELNAKDFTGWADMKRAIDKVAANGSVFPVYMIDHSGLSFRMGRDFQDCDPGAWDSGPVGFIYTTKAKVKECGTPRKLIEQCLADEIGVFDSFVRGDAYGYVVEDRNGVEVDSCWGYFEYKVALDDGKSQADWFANAADTKAMLAAQGGF